MPRIALVLLLVSAPLVGCLSARAPTPALDTASDLVGHLADRGWSARPDRLIDYAGVGTTGTIYTVRKLDTRRRIYVFETEADGQALPRAEVDRDLDQLQRLWAGRGATFYSRPRFFVVTFGRVKDELDLRLAQWLGAPVRFVDTPADGERQG